MLTSAVLVGLAACVPDRSASPGEALSGTSGTPGLEQSPSSAASTTARADVPAPASTSTSTSQTVPAPTFGSSVGPITDELAARMSASWRSGCPVPLEDLRYLTLTHRTFEGGAATGELVVHADVAEHVVAVFEELFDAGYPVRSMRLVDDFGASDDASMAADNTSAFNCRLISRGTGWSEHAYGRAIDLNPRENPYVRGSLVLPPEGAEYASRPDLPGVIHDDDVVVRAFADAGWLWGGHWTSPVDYQHFSVTGR